MLDDKIIKETNEAMKLAARILLGLGTVAAVIVYIFIEDKNLAYVLLIMSLIVFALIMGAVWYREKNSAALKPIWEKNDAEEKNPAIFKKRMVTLVVVVALLSALMFFTGKPAEAAMLLVVGLVGFIISMVRFNNYKEAGVQKMHQKQTENPAPETIKKRMIIIAIIMLIATVFLFLKGQHYMAAAVFVGTVIALIYAFIQFNKLKKAVSQNKL